MAQRSLSMLTNNIRKTFTEQRKRRCFHSVTGMVAVSRGRKRSFVEVLALIVYEYRFSSYQYIDDYDSIKVHC